MPLERDVGDRPFGNGEVSHFRRSSIENVMPRVWVVLSLVTDGNGCNGRKGIVSRSYSQVQFFG